ncbi:mevalonate kinase-like [Camponotus floridanus]|uniref:mevalonate kinase-like n=1 Tax=Camponotus floridanus TaxID=104421 RepID=UPI000DC6C85A|nr:mevalonate kinase-like [Camponotus floridanus]
MIEFKISAPGRIILSGEYAAIYGKNFVMANLNRRTTLKFAEIIKYKLFRKTCNIEFPDVGLSLNLPFELVKNFLHSCDIIGTNNARLFKYVQYFITVNGMWSTYEQRFSLQMFFFSLFFIVRREQLDIRSFCVHVKTEIPMHAGLGSTTSFAVCVAACFLHWSRLQRGDHNEFSFDELLLIGTSAVECRKPICNAMYMMDIPVCLNSNVAMRCQLLNCYLAYNISTFLTPEKRILLIDSTVCQNKYKQIEYVAQLKRFYPEIIDRHLNTIDEISNNISTKLALDDQFDILQNYIQMNQHVLSELNLSNEKLNDISEIAYVYGYVGKLTGIGERKFAYILLRPGISGEEIGNISAHLESNFPVTVTSISCDGIRIED